MPRLWVWQSATSSWQRIVLTTGSATAPGEVNAVSGDGRAIGQSNGQAAAWAPNGSGGYALTVLGSGVANGMNSTGALMVGALNGHAVYWQWSGSGWGAPVTLPGGCASAADVADTGRIALNSCPFGNKTYAAYMDPPYSSPNQLGGLGPQSNYGTISGMSRSGQYITAQADGGVYWYVP